MKIYSLKHLCQSLGRSIMISFLVITTLSICIFIILHHNNEKNLDKFRSQQLEHSITLYQSTLAEKLTIIANSTIFVDFLRSGKTTRKFLLPDLRYEFANAHLESIKGMTILNKNNQIIYQQGDITQNSINLSLCYLNRTLNNIGECNFSWKIFFLKKDMINQLKKINNAIQSCKKCDSINFLKHKTFGNFLIKQPSPLMLSIKIMQIKNYQFYFYTCLMIFFLVSLTIWNRYRVKSIINRYIVNPLEELTEKLLLNETPLFYSNHIKEIQYLIKHLQDWQIETKENENQKNEAAIGRLVSQVAHDIRSPLAALDIAIKYTKNIEEKERLLIRNAIFRIHDIANNLLSQYKQKNIQEQLITLKPNLIADNLLKVISEKRIQEESTHIEYLITIEEEAYGLFANVIPQEFHCAISNLIQNSLEAISDFGRITICLKHANQELSLIIEDTGCGIPLALLPKILNEKISIGKKGSGLGLTNAKENIKKWGGKFTIKSEKNIGTKICIALPITQPPPWFTTHLILNPNSVIIIVDNDLSIHALWENRLIDLPLKLIKFQTPSELIHWHNNHSNLNAFYFIDYEFLNYDQNGLYLAKKLNIGKRTYLVTNNYENSSIQEQCLSINASIIPKAFASYIPIKLLNNYPCNASQLNRST